VIDIQGKKNKEENEDEEAQATGTSNSVVCLDWNVCNIITLAICRSVITQSMYEYYGFVKQSRGTILASGSFDGRVRLWNGGRCTNTLTSHTGPVSSLKWNKKTDMLLTYTISIWPLPFPTNLLMASCVICWLE
jgi:WD40 repeat protein